MRTINRAVLLVRPKEPYLRWASELGGESPSSGGSLRGMTSVYLVAEDPRGEQESAPIKNYYRRIFELELEAWHTDPSDWPKKRDFRVFREWFAVEAQSIVVDLEDSWLEVEAD